MPPAARLGINCSEALSGIVFEAGPSLSVYAAYGEGFRANIGADARGEVFDPETTRSGEIGAKLGALGGRLTGTVAAFEFGKSNMLAADPVNPGFSLPVGAARSRGLEVDLDGRLPGKLTLLFSYAYVDAEARRDVRDPDFGLAIRAGDPLINIPKHSLSLQLARDVAVEDTSLRIGSGVQHVGKRLGEAATSFHLPNHTLVRLFATWDVTDRLELSGQVTNLFDDTWYANSYSRLWVQPGTPRAATVTLRYAFGAQD
jgi:iron complex outermembrane receptor protein